MIQVTLPAPPANYLGEVKAPGETFLLSTPSPIAKDWRQHDYWRKIHKPLYKKLRGVCVYCASWTPRRSRSQIGIDSTSIDHFVPKSIEPNKAYEWSNFRLSRTRLNIRKGSHTDVIDPCVISDGWFILDFTTFLIKPAPSLSNDIVATITATINRLKLNDDNDYVNERIGIIRNYTLGKMTFLQLQEKYPFIAQQIRDQDFDRHFKPRLYDYFLGRPTR